MTGVVPANQPWERTMRHTASSIAHLIAIASALWPALAGAADPICTDGQRRVIRADVIALDQPMMINRLGTNRPQGMIYALRHDVVPIDISKPLGPGNVQLRPGKRPRPLVLRVNVGDCLRIAFANFLLPVPASPQQPVTRTASI